MKVEIVALAEPHFAPLREALDLVAREKRFLAFTEAPSEDDAYAFYRNILANDLVFSVALADGQVAGWCDVLPTHGQARSHLGVLGIALLPAFRRFGIGHQVIQHAISRAWARGMTRIELTVRADNLNAKALYERVGFVTEGLHRRAFRVDGEYHDAWSMSLLH